MGININKKVDFCLTSIEGKEAIDIIQKAKEQGKFYTLIFIDLDIKTIAEFVLKVQEQSVKPKIVGLSDRISNLF